jgi:hypothetical protein
MSPAIPGMILGGTPSLFSTTLESFIAKSQPFMKVVVMLLMISVELLDLDLGASPT